MAADGAAWSAFLQQQALETFAKAFAQVTDHKRHANLTLVVDPSLQVLLERLAFGHGGKAFYDQLGIATVQSLASCLQTKPHHASHSASNGTNSQSTMVAPPRVECLVFLVPSLPSLAKTIGAIIHFHETCLALPKKRLYGVLWTPNATSECCLELEKQGLLAKTNQTSLALGFLPLETHVLSLCDASSFEQLYFHRNQRCLSTLVANLFQLEQQTQSNFQNVICRGEFATNCQRMMQLARQVMQRRTPSAPRSHQQQPSSMRFSKLVLFDRMEDPISMLLTPMTYEGLLDALVGLNHGVVKYEKQQQQEEQDNVTNDDSIAKLAKAIVNENDDLFASLRDVNFNILISSKLQQMAQDLAKEIRSYPTSSSSSSNDNDSASSWSSSSNSEEPVTRTLAEIQALIRKVPTLVQRKKSLALHLDLVDQIKQHSEHFALRQAIEAEMQIVCAGKNISQSEEVDLFLEQALLRDPPLLSCDQLLKLVCLRSLLTNGFHKKKTNKNSQYVTWLRHQICHAYGHNLLPVLIRLEKLGLLTQDSKEKWNFGALKRSLGLMNGILEDEDTIQPNDINFMFPYTGYAPMSIRMIEEALGIKFRKSPLGMKMPLGSNNNNNNSISSMNMNSDASDFQANGVENVLVVFIGGVTVAELAAIRLLNRQLQGRFQFVVASTSIWHASHLFKPESGDSVAL